MANNTITFMHENEKNNQYIQLLLCLRALPASSGIVLKIVISVDVGAAVGKTTFRAADPTSNGSQNLFQNKDIN